MEAYDVIIIGAGPAGGECARTLSRKGFSTLIVDRMHNFSVNCYSSAGAPIEVLSDYQLPQEVVGSTFNKFMVHSSHNRLVFRADTPRGIVMDFAKLRAFLARETEAQGGKVMLGTVYKSHELVDDLICVTLKTSNQPALQVRGKILVDATGNDRKVLAKSPPANAFQSTGIEYLVEVPTKMYQQWANALSFFMGHKWMPQGYSWIFPMEPNRLKVGVGRYFQDEYVVPHENSYKHYLTTMMKECLGSDSLPVIDRHGRAIHYSYHHRDMHYNKQVIAIGDSVSTINPLALEGIRHAMESARIAAKHISLKLVDPGHSFRHYQKDLKRYYGYKWLISEKLVNYIYRSPKDETVEEMLEAYSNFNFDEIFNMGFHYNYRSILKFSRNLLWIKARKLLESLRKCV